jgi:hypothetical protein
MDGFDLPMSFGKKAVVRANNTQGRVDKTKRVVSYNPCHSVWET